MLFVSDSDRSQKSVSTLSDNHSAPSTELNANLTVFIIREVSSGFGEIVLGEHRERFEMPLHYWKVAAYEKQWDDACRLIVDGAEQACFITGMNDPRSANFIQWWPVWRVGERIHIQNQILFMKMLSVPFDEDAPHVHVPERKTHSDDGDRLSEWVLPRAAFGKLRQ